LKIAVTLSSPRQDVKLPGPPDASATIESLTGSGAGEAKVDLTHMLPLESKMDVSMQLRMSGREKAGAKRQTMNMRMDMGMTLESK
jgi:hypothetical protein